MGDRDLKSNQNNRFADSGSYWVRVGLMADLGCNQTLTEMQPEQDS